MDHYPGRCESLVPMLTENAPESSSNLDVYCVYGHLHDTVCKKSMASKSFAAPNATAFSDSASTCHWAQLGGGGGCCPHQVIEKGKAGFGILTFEPDGGM